MSFQSILFKKQDDLTLAAPDFFTDLNLDQVIDEITAGKKEYELKPFFYTSLQDTEAIEYRHEIFQELENGLVASVKSFAQKMRLMREYLVKANKLYYKYQKERYFLDAVELYCDAVGGLDRDLKGTELKSCGFLDLREYITKYIQSDVFVSLLSGLKKLKRDLAAVRYCLLINGNTITVRQYQGETDYSTVVEGIFEKFKKGIGKNYLVKVTEYPEMNHIEEQIADLVAQLYPGVFAELDQYYDRNAAYMDKTIARFDREIQFYIAYLNYMAIFKRTGLQFCYPQICCQSKEIFVYGGFDSALAYKRITEKSAVVCNDFYLKGAERIFVVSGPNQGGKTTFARMFGQLHYMACLGCPVPGTEAQLFLFDRIFTHFEKEENIKNLRGKLQDDLIRIYDILSRATPNSIIILNEIFTSTALQDAIYLGKKVMEKIIRLDLLCVCVTFIEELASLDEKTVSMVSTVVPDNPARRTYKIVRSPADGLSHAIFIARKYRLTYDCLKERLKL